MGVSINGGTPKSSILMGCSWIFHYKMDVSAFDFSILVPLMNGL